MTRCLCVLTCVLVCTTNAFAQLPVVPGAVGFGMETRAAYACGVTPRIIRVTNVNSGGSGSFRAALEDPSPRVIIFDVSGTIDLTSQVIVSNPCVTIAGQTAPSPGITVMRHGIEFNTHDVLLQHIRIRPGDLECNTGTAVWNYGGGPYNVVYDHVSVSWSQDESISVGGAFNVTFWNVLEAEGLYFARGSEGCTGGGADVGHGMLVYAGSQNIYMGNSILSTNVARNPYQEGDTTFVFANNLVYQWSGSNGYNAANFDAGGSPFGGPWYAAVIGNVFKAGPQTVNPGDTWAFVYGTGGGAPWGNQIFRSDNAIDAGGMWVGDEYNGFSYNPNVSWVPVGLPSGFSAGWSGSVEGNVLARAGARPLDRDAVDNRVIADIANRSGGFISSQDQVGGWPYLPTNVRSLSTPGNPHGDDDGDGYTNLEEWLHGFASELENGWSNYLPNEAPVSIQEAPVASGGGQAVAAGPSPDGARVPSVAYIVDNSSATWTIGYDGMILRDGQDTIGRGVQILWYAGNIYVMASNGSWWVWGGGYSWSFVGYDDPSRGSASGSQSYVPGPAVSPDGERVPYAASITDSSGSTWTIGYDGMILRGGQDTVGRGVQILWYGGNIYVMASDGSWWVWGGGYSWTFIGYDDPTWY